MLVACCPYPAERFHFWEELLLGDEHAHQQRVSPIVCHTIATVSGMHVQAVLSAIITSIHAAMRCHRCW